MFPFPDGTHERFVAVLESASVAFARDQSGSTYSNVDEASIVGKALDSIVKVVDAGFRLDVLEVHGLETRERRARHGTLIGGRVKACS